MINYIPKGSMCISCKFIKDRTCLELDFSKMKHHKKLEDGAVQVICSRFRKDSTNDGLSN